MNGEKEYYAVTLVPGGRERLFDLSIVEASVPPNPGEVDGSAATIRGGGYEPAIRAR